MAAAENTPVVVAAYAAAREKTLQSLLLPSLLASGSSLLVALFDCVEQRFLSPVLILAGLFALVSVACVACDIDAKSCDAASWRRSMAAIILGWLFAIFWVVGYHSPLMDLGCIRCAGTFLSLIVARDAPEAIAYLVVHWVLCLGAHVPHHAMEMIFLLCCDSYMVYATWGRHVSIEALERLTSLSLSMSMHSFHSVHNTLSYLCDAAVVVDEKLELQSPARDLGALLGRSCAQGRMVQELVYHEDLETFTATMADHFTSLETGNTGVLSALPVRLMDAYGLPFSVHVFTAAVALLDGAKQRRYLLGISEQSLRRKKDSASISRPTTASSKSLGSCRLRTRKSSPAEGSDGSGGWWASPTKAELCSAPQKAVRRSLLMPMSDPELERSCNVHAGMPLVSSGLSDLAKDL